MSSARYEAIDHLAIGISKRDVVNIMFIIRLKKTHLRDYISQARFNSINIYLKVSSILIEEMSKKFSSR